MLRKHLAAGGSFTTGFHKAGSAIAEDDKKAIIERTCGYRRGGKRASEAAKRALDEHIGQVLPDLVLREPERPYTRSDGRQADPDTRGVREAEGEVAGAGSAPAATGRAAEPGPAAVPRLRGPAGAIPRPSRPRVVALGIAADIERAGSAALVGRRVAGPDQLAELAQVYRDPRYETFRVFFVKGDEIVHATGVSARMPGYAPMVPAGMTQEHHLQWFKDQMQATGADGYYLLHNHPTGNPTPSHADERIRQYLGARVPGLRAHVVINSGKYAVLTPTDQLTEILPIGKDALLTPSLPSKLLGGVITGPSEVMVLGKQLQRDGWVTLIGIDNQQRVRTLVEAPSSTLQRPNAVLLAILRRTMRMSGSQGLFLVGSDADVASAPVQRALGAGLLLDAVGEDRAHASRARCSGWIAGLRQHAGAQSGRAAPRR